MNDAPNDFPPVRSAVDGRTIDLGPVTVGPIDPEHPRDRCADSGSCNQHWEFVSILAPRHESQSILALLREAGWEEKDWCTLTCEGMDGAQVTYGPADKPANARP